MAPPESMHTINIIFKKYFPKSNHRHFVLREKNEILITKYLDHPITKRMQKELSKSVKNYNETTMKTTMKYICIIYTVKDIAHIYINYFFRLT